MSAKLLVIPVLLALSACAHLNQPATPIYNSRIPGNVDSLICLATELGTAGFEVDLNIEDATLDARRLGSEFGAGIAQAHVEFDGDERAQSFLYLAVRNKEVPLSRPPNQTRPSTTPAMIRRQHDSMARTVVSREFDVMMKECRLSTPVAQAG